MKNQHILERRIIARILSEAPRKGQFRDIDNGRGGSIFVPDRASPSKAALKKAAHQRAVKLSDAGLTWNAMSNNERLRFLRTEVDFDRDTRNDLAQLTWEELSLPGEVESHVLDDIANSLRHW